MKYQAFQRGKNGCRCLMLILTNQRTYFYMQIKFFLANPADDLFLISNIKIWQMTPNPSPLLPNEAQFDFHARYDSNVEPQDLRADIRPESPGKWYNGSMVQCESSCSTVSIRSNVSMSSVRRSSTYSSRSSFKKSDAKR